MTQRNKDLTKRGLREVVWEHHRWEEATEAEALINSKQDLKRGVHWGEKKCLACGWNGASGPAHRAVCSICSRTQSCSGLLRSISFHTLRFQSASLTSLTAHSEKQWIFHSAQVCSHHVKIYNIYQNTLKIVRNYKKKKKMNLRNKR